MDVLSSSVMAKPKVRRRQGTDIMYGLLTDLIQIYWEYQKIRLEHEHWRFDYGRKPKVSVESEQGSLEYKTRHSDSPLNDFIDAYGGLLAGSIGQFTGDKQALSMLLGKDPDEFITQPPDELSELSDAKYTQDLVSRLERHGGQHTKNIIPVYLPKFNITIDIVSGMLNALQTLAYMSLKGGAYSDIIPEVEGQRMARTFLDHHELLRSKIGMSRTKEGQNILILGDDDLYTESLTREVLIEHGQGSAYGCPASGRPSDKCIAFLRGLGVEYSGSTVVQEFARMVQGSFDESVGKWYISVSSKWYHWLEKHHIDPHERKFFETYKLGKQ